MTLAVDTTSHASPSSGVSISWNHTCGGSSNKLVALVGIGLTSGTPSDRDLASVTYNGVALSLVIRQDDTNFEHVEIWKLNAPVTGSSLTLVATGGSSFSQIQAGAVSFNDASANEGTPNGNSVTNGAANPSVTVVDSANGDIVISVLCSDIGNQGTTTENGVLLFEDEDVGGGDSDFNAQQQVASGASTVCSWTAISFTGGGWAAAGVAIKQASVSSPQPGTLAQFDKDLRGQIAWW